MVIKSDQKLRFFTQISTIFFEYLTTGSLIDFMEWYGKNQAFSGKIYFFLSKIFRRKLFCYKTLMNYSFLFFVIIITENYHISTSVLKKVRLLRNFARKHLNMRKTLLKIVKKIMKINKKNNKNWM